MKKWTRGMTRSRRVWSSSSESPLGLVVECRAGDVLVAHRPYALASNVRILTKLSAAAVKVRIQSTRSLPRCRSFRKPPTVFIQPKSCSIVEPIALRGVSVRLAERHRNRFPSVFLQRLGHLCIWNRSLTRFNGISASDAQASGLEMRRQDVHVRSRTPNEDVIARRSRSISFATDGVISH
jgi:hypothetical protein